MEKGTTVIAWWRIVIGALKRVISQSLLLREPTAFSAEVKERFL